MAFLFLVAATLHCLFRLRADYSKGVFWCVFYLAWLPHGLKIMSDSLPDITVHRTIMAVLLACSVTRLSQGGISAHLPMVKVIGLILCSEAISLSGGIAYSLGWKRFATEIFIEYCYYAILWCFCCSVANRRVVVNAILWGVSCAAVIAVIERYYVNVSFVLLPHLAMVPDRGASIATYEHRIHLGYAMAMVLPIVLVRAITSNRAREVLLYGVIGLTMGTALYFAQSRGPWLAFALASGTLLLLLKGVMLRRLMKAFCILFLLLLCYSGVRDTIIDALSTIWQHDTEQGASAEYRKILWRVADSELSKDSFRWLFGYGPSATAVTDIQSYFERNRGGLAYLTTGGSSWDNEYAARLFQYGYIGFGLLVILAAATLTKLLAKHRAVTGDGRVVIGSVVAVFVVYQWAMTNVAIFSPQLSFIYWALVAVGLGTAEEIEEESQELLKVVVVSNANAA